MNRAEVLADLLLNGEPTKAGAIVEVDDNTFANLQRQGLLKPAKERKVESDPAAAGPEPAKPRRPSGATPVPPQRNSDAFEDELPRPKKRRGRPPRSKKKAGR